MNEEEIIALIMKGSIYHADEGTSGYLLSNETAKKIYDLLKNAGALQIHGKTDEWFLTDIIGVFVRKIRGYFAKV